MIEPYCWKIEDMSIDRVKCLVTGQDLLLRPSEKVNGLNLVREYTEKEWDETGTLSIVVSGTNASTVIYTSIQFGRYVLADPIYLDQSGGPDYGLRRGQCIVLDRDKLMKVWDDFISGEINDNITDRW